MKVAASEQSVMERVNLHVDAVDVVDVVVVGDKLWKE